MNLDLAFTTPHVAANRKKKKSRFNEAEFLAGAIDGPQVTEGPQVANTLARINRLEEIKEAVGDGQIVEGYRTVDRVEKSLEIAYDIYKKQTGVPYNKGNV